MKLIIRNSFFFFLIFISVILVATQSDRIYAFVSDMFVKKEGVLTVVSVDAENGYPIKDTIFQLFDMETNEVVGEYVSSEDGHVKITNLPQQKSFKVIQTAVNKPYQLNKEPKIVELLTEHTLLTIENEVYPAVTTYKRADNEIIVTEMNLPVKEVMQIPELPNGCEVTALASVLHYYGYDVDKTVLADEYLPKIPFEVKSGNLYGADPFKAYAGEPRSKNQGFFSYVPPIIETVNRYFAKVNGSHQPRDLTGSSSEQLLDYVREGIPVIIWTTINQKDPQFNYSWYVNGTDKKIDVIRNSHTVVLSGYSEDEVYVMDPLKGNVAYPKQRFFEIYEKAGSHAMIIN